LVFYLKKILESQINKKINLCIVKKKGVIFLRQGCLNFYIKVCISFFCVNFFIGCAAPLWMTVSHTAADIVLVRETGRTSGEHGLSYISGKDCQFIRLLDNQKVCMSEKEYEKYLLTLNCDIYEWSSIGRVRCQPVK